MGIRRRYESEESLFGLPPACEVKVHNTHTIYNGWIGEYAVSIMEVRCVYPSKKSHARVTELISLRLS